MDLTLPPDLERIFIIEELLEREKEDDEIDEAPLEESSDNEAASLKTARLPDRYNITFIDVIIRDPLWAFVFWEVKLSEKEAFDKIENFGGYYLRVSALCLREQEAENEFIIPVGMDDSAWYLGFPSADDSQGSGDPIIGRWYRVDLCAEKENQEIVLCSSRPFKLPNMARKCGAQKGRCKNKLLDLSGFEDFHVIRHGDRANREKIR
jgi:hypothetical protein